MVKRRNTQPKQEVLTLLKTSGTALSHEMIRLGLNIPVDRATIYRVLNRFCDEGLVHRIIGDDGKQYFMLCRNCQSNHRHNHFHFRCRKCGTVECLPEEFKVSLPAGYTSESFNALISGHCKKCS